MTEEEKEAAREKFLKATEGMIERSRERQRQMLEELEQLKLGFAKVSIVNKKKFLDATEGMLERLTALKAVSKKCTQGTSEK